MSVSARIGGAMSCNVGFVKYCAIVPTEMLYADRGKWRQDEGAVDPQSRLICRDVENGNLGARRPPTFWQIDEPSLGRWWSVGAGNNGAFGIGEKDTVGTNDQNV